jgi:hypothetical protein
LDDTASILQSTYLDWLLELGFTSAQLFDRLSEPARPKDIEVVDKLLRPLVEAPGTNEPGQWEHWITAIK